MKLKNFPKFVDIIILGILIIVFFDFTSANAQQISSFEEFAPVILDQVRVKIQIQENGIADVSQSLNISGRYESALNFTWIINSAQISHLKIQRNGELLNLKEYKVIRKNGKNYLSNIWLPAETKNLEISFKDYEAITPAKQYDQLRFEITPAGMSINSLDINAVLPKGLPSSQRDKLSATSYGIHGVGNSGAFVAADGSFHFFGSNLGPYSSFTAVASFPKNQVKFPLLKTINNLINSLGGLFWVVFSILIPIVALMVMISVIIRQRTKEYIKPAKILYRFPPDSLSPALVGVLYRERVGPREIAATLVDLAERGYIFVINRGRGEYRFGERRNFEGLADFEKYLGVEIFRGGMKRGLTEIKQEPKTQIFSETISKIYVSIYNQIASLGYFVENPNQVHLKFHIVGIAFFFLSVIGFILGAMFLPDPPYLLFGFFGMSLASLIIIRMSDYLPLRTKAGSEVLSRWLSFREFLKTYQKHVGYQEIMEGIFLKYLPYAFTLDVERAWATHFVNVPFKMPDWYSSPKDIYVLSEFTADLYPLIEYITSIMESMREPVSK